jgi:hypothetical protein
VTGPAAARRDPAATTAAAPAAGRGAGGLRSTLTFLGAWTLLDVMLNLRWPGREPPLWAMSYLVPSFDVVAILGLLALLGRRGWRVPPRARVALAATLVVLRALRLADGNLEHFFRRPLNLYIDGPLLPELVRLLRSTVPLPALLLGLVLAAGLAVALGAASYRALAFAESYLARPPGPRVFFGTVALLALLSPLWPGGGQYTALHVGLFAPSIIPRLAREVSFLAHARDYRAQKVAALAANEERLSRLPAGLEKLGGADLFLFLIESYGRTVVDNPAFAARIVPAYDAFERELARLGMTAASSLLDSPTFGGHSWLAHGTLAVGMRITDQLEYTMLLMAKPQPTTMARFFQRAGYHTVLVQPGTTRPIPEGEVNGFDRRIYAADLGYRGPDPHFNWAPMPDQFTIDVVQRTEIARATRPLFVEYALISSHAPWNRLPPVIDDWDRLDGGRVYAQVPSTEYPLTWSNLAKGGEAYVASLLYDLDVLRRYLPRLAERHALVIVLGDHQPVEDVSGAGASWAVPIHVISRDPALLEPFVARGYARGMRPPAAMDRVPGMETLLTTLMAGFSNG